MFKLKTLRDWLICLCGHLASPIMAPWRALFLYTPLTAPHPTKLWWDKELSARWACLYIQAAGGCLGIGGQNPSYCGYLSEWRMIQFSKENVSERWHALSVEMFHNKSNPESDKSNRQTRFFLNLFSNPRNSFLEKSSRPSSPQLDLLHCSLLIFHNYITNWGNGCLKMLRCFMFNKLLGSCLI